MANPDDYLYEYAVIRYMPHVERGEFINVGLLMMCKRRRWIHCEIHLDPDRLRIFDPEVEIEALRRHLSLFEQKDVPGRDFPIEERYRWLTAAKSAVLQTGPSHPGIALCSKEDATDKSFSADPLAPLHSTFSRLMNTLVK